MSRPTQIIIDLKAIQANCALAQSLAAHSSTVAVVKADAYGHGAMEVARALESQVAMLTVSCIEEAIVLRDGGINKPILLLEGCFSAEEILLAARYQLQLVVHTQQQVMDLQNSHVAYAFTLWLKIDSGMHRLGIKPVMAAMTYEQLSSLACVDNIVLCTHLASADALESDFTLKQLACYEQAIGPILSANASDNKIPEQSIANSAGVLAWPQTRLSWNRPGIMLYGLSPFAESHPEADKLLPAMTFKSKIIALRDIDPGECVGYGHTWCATRSSTIATVAAGYGDGYPRTAKSGTPVLINGHRVPLVGRVSMDMICVDVTDLPQVNLGDEAVLWGVASQGQSLSANEVASFADTIAYELVTRMPSRAKRSYI
ncbi:MAG: alanine racemase [Paraglaciecola sp.]|jgi:alanine racemase